MLIFCLNNSFLPETRFQLHSSKSNWRRRTWFNNLLVFYIRLISILFYYILRLITFVCLNRLHYKLFLISLRHTLQTIIKFSFCWNFLIIFVIFKISYQWLSLIFIKRSLIVNTLSTIRLPTTKFSCLLSYQSLFLHQFLIPLNKSFFFLLNRLPIVLNKFAIKFINR